MRHSGRRWPGEEHSSWLNQVSSAARSTPHRRRPTPAPAVTSACRSRPVRSRPAVLLADPPATVGADGTASPSWAVFAAAAASLWWRLGRRADASRRLVRRHRPPAATGHRRATISSHPAALAFRAAAVFTALRAPPCSRGSRSRRHWAKWWIRRDRKAAALPDRGLDELRRDHDQQFHFVGRLLDAAEGNAEPGNVGQPGKATVLGFHALLDQSGQAPGSVRPSSPPPCRPTASARPAHSRR